MRRSWLMAVAFALSACASAPAPAPVAKRPAQPDHKAAIVAASVYGYEISTNSRCPCPYSQGGSCKGQRAYEKPGGAEPRCYKSDVSEDDVKRWKELVKAAPPKP